MRATQLVTVMAMLFSCVLSTAQEPGVSRFSGRKLLQSVAPQNDKASTNRVPEDTKFLPQDAASAAAFPGFLAAKRTVAGLSSDSSGVYVVLEGEFDGKAGTDIAAVQGFGRINLMLNDGKGNYTASYGTTPSPLFNASSGDTADLNGDGLSDIVLTNSSTASINVYLNQGNAQFSAPVTYTTVRPLGVLGSQIIGSVKLGDVNGDGMQDMVFPVSYANSATGKTTLTFFTFLGDGHGNFGSPVVTAYTLSAFVYPAGGHSIELADMAHTSKLGAVLQLLYYSSSSGSYAMGLMLAPGNGDGSFGSASYGGQPIASTNLGKGTLSVRDFDNDGNQDILFADGASAIQIAYGNGDGTIKPPTVAIADVGVTASMTIGDFNNDGIPDVAALRSGLATIFAGIGNGTFNSTPLSQYTGGLVGVQPTYAADLDGDGNQDFIWIEPFYNQMSLYQGNGDGTFIASPAVSAANASASIPNNTQRATDFSVLGSGHFASTSRYDLLIEEGDHIDYGILQSQGAVKMSPVFTASQLNNVDFVEPLAVDLNGDGYSDVVMATLTGIKVALSKKDGTFSAPVNTTVPVSLGCVLGYGAAGDINGDGKQDLVIAYTGNAYCYASGSSPSGYAVLLGDGAGGFTSSTFTSFGSAVGLSRLADMNGDGQLDLVLVDLNYGTYNVSVLQGNGDGTFDVAHPHVAFHNASYRVNDARAVDVDGDGQQDLLMTYYGTGTSKSVAFYGGKGDFTFADPVALVSGATGPYLEVQDFNGDGLPDIAVNLASTSDRTLANLAVLINAGSGKFAAPQFYVTPTDASNDYNSMLFSGDFNGDGALDIVGGSGDGYVPSQLLLNQAGSSWQLSAQPGQSTEGYPVQLIAQTTGASNLTGSVKFSINGTLLGSGTVNAGIATYTASSLPAGTDIVTATYSGDTTHLPVNMAPLSLVVAAQPPSFTFAGSPGTVSVARGATASVMLTVTTNASFNGTVAFTCENLPENAYCSFASSSLQLNGAAAQSNQLNIATSASASRNHPSTFTSNGLMLAGIACLPLLWRRRRTLTACVTMLLFFTMVGCAGGSDTHKTPLGEAIVLVKATATLSSGAQQVQTISVPVTVTSR